MTARLLRFVAPLVLLALAGCDAVDCEGVEPCRDGVALRIADASGYADGVFLRRFSPSPGAYTVDVSAGAYRDACSFAVSAPPAAEPEIDAGTCGDRLRMVPSGSDFSLLLGYPVLDAESVVVEVTRDGEAVSAIAAPLAYARPSDADTACRTETCRQASIDVPVE